MYKKDVATGVGHVTKESAGSIGVVVSLAAHLPEGKTEGKDADEYSSKSNNGFRGPGHFQGGQEASCGCCYFFFFSFFSKAERKKGLEDDFCPKEQRGESAGFAGGVILAMAIHHVRG